MHRGIKRMMFLVAGLLAVLLLLLLLALAQLQDPNSAPPSVGPSLTASIGDAADQLPRLTVAERVPTDTFTVAIFPGWVVNPGTGCDVRADYLRATGSNVTTRDGCRPTDGQWVSPYDGRMLTAPPDLGVDHLIPLRNVWASGANGWPAARQAAYANDARQLTVMTTSLTADRADRGPEEWKPPLRASWCRYAAAWVNLKAQWGLTVTGAEKAALTEMLRPCEE